MGAVHHLHLVRSRDSERPRQRTPIRLARVTIFILAALAFVLVVYHRSAGGLGPLLQTMGPEERAGLARRVLDNLRFCSDHPSDALNEFCQNEARFVTELPECGAGCQVQARRALNRNSRGTSPPSRF